MTTEQLLLAAQLEGIATVGWDNHLHLQAYLVVETLDLGRKRFNFMMDEARQIVEFPGEARTLLIMVLNKELTKGEGQTNEERHPDKERSRPSLTR
jgi:hypothetical protein